MPSAPVSASGFPKSMVVAMGIHTQHWRETAKEFPGILNCCIDVREAFTKEWTESTSGTGFDGRVRDRMKAKETWRIVWEVALRILREFGLLVVLCNHGKHRSLSLACEVAAHTGCELLSIRDRRKPWIILSLSEITHILFPRLIAHIDQFGSRPHPVAGIHIAKCTFDGTAWAQMESSRWIYLHTHQGDIVIEILSMKNATSEGWAYGTLIGGDGNSPSGYYPPSYVTPMDKRYFASCRNLFSSLVKRYMP